MAKGFNSRGMGGMGGGNMKNMNRQKQKMQQDMLKAQEELEAKTYEAAAGGGVVSAAVSGKKELVSVTIDPEAVDPDDVEMLQDLIVAAVNEAKRCRETGEEKTILFGLTGTGYFDLAAYTAYNEKRMNDYIPTEEDLQKGFAGIPSIPGIQ